MSFLEHAVKELLTAGVEHLISARELAHLEKEFGDAVAIVSVQMHENRLRPFGYEHAHLLVFDNGVTLTYTKGFWRFAQKRFFVSAAFGSDAISDWKTIAPGKHVCISEGRNRFLLTQVSIKPKGLNIRQLCRIQAADGRRVPRDENNLPKSTLRVREESSVSARTNPPVERSPRPSKAAISAGNALGKFVGRLLK